MMETEFLCPGELGRINEVSFGHPVVLNLDGDLTTMPCPAKEHVSYIFIQHPLNFVSTVVDVLDTCCSTSPGLGIRILKALGEVVLA